MASLKIRARGLFGEGFMAKKCGAEKERHFRIPLKKVNFLKPKRGQP